ncbi:MAG: type I restriction-modification system subunit M [Syntrophales bacterium]|nr:type I restriction-modification system subunit M [Syntrophales bacterium]
MAKSNGNGANLGFENQMWAAADKLRGHMDASEYKHVVLGLIFLKYISDAFQAMYKQLEASKETAYTDPEDRDEYAAANIFWVPKEARWSVLQSNAKQPTIGKLIDDAMVAIEKENPTLKGVLPKDYGRPSLDKYRLGELIDIVSKIGLGDDESRSKDILGRVYEYFLGRFAAAEGKGGGEFYTPRCVVNLLVRMIEPYKGRVYDPCCGSGGMFVQSERFVEEHGGRLGDIAIYGQESNSTTWRLAMMNLAIRGLDANLGGQNADSFHNDLHKDLRADFILANPPFNMSDWGGERLREDARWKYGIPPVNNANYAWIQHFIHHLSPTGVAGFVMANGSMSTNTASEGEIRRNIIDADLVDCMIALPGQLFYTTQIPVCLWFVARNKKNGKFRDRSGHTLFIDARKLGSLIDRTHKDFSDEEIDKIAATYHAWRGVGANPRVRPNSDDGHAQGSALTEYQDVLGFCKSATIDEIREHGYVLTPGRYVGAAEIEDDGVPFEEKMAELSATLYEQFAEADRLEAVIKRNLEVLGYGQ